MQMLLERALVLVLATGGVSHGAEKILDSVNQARVLLLVHYDPLEGVERSSLFQGIPQRHDAQQVCER